MRVPTRQCGISSLPEGASPQEPGLLGGVQNFARGSPVAGPAVTFGVSVLETSASRSLKMAHTENLGAGVDSAGPPRGAVQLFPVGYPGVAPETYKFRGG